jgi:glycosyltransferase involved in cell wall biosynthesis
MPYTIIYYSPHPTHDIVSEVGYATHQRETIIALEGLGHNVIKVIMGGTELNGLKYTKSSVTSHKGIKGFIKQLIPRFIWVTLKDLKLQFHDRRAAHILRHAIVEYKPDFVYERSEILQYRSLKVIEELGIPYLLEVNAPFIEEMKSLEGYSLMHLFAKRMENWKLSQAKKIFTVSTALKDYLVDTYKINENKFLVAPNRINLLKFKSEYKAKDNINTFGFVGSILPFHKVELLVKAAAIVVKTHPEIKGIIVGDGAYLNRLEHLSASLGLVGHLEFTGRIPHNLVYKQIEKMDICIMPGTNWYGSPVKIFEYAAMGKPIIAPNVGPLRDVMTNMVDGLLVEQNVEAIAEAIIWCIENPARAYSMSFVFKEKVETEYTWRHSAQEIIEAYEQ